MAADSSWLTRYFSLTSLWRRSLASDSTWFSRSFSLTTVWRRSSNISMLYLFLISSSLALGGAILEGAVESLSRVSLKIITSTSAMNVFLSSVSRMRLLLSRALESWGSSGGGFCFCRNYLTFFSNSFLLIQYITSINPCMDDKTPPNRETPSTKDSGYWTCWVILSG